MISYRHSSCCLLFFLLGDLFNKKAVLSQGEPSDVAVNFDTIELYGAVRFPHYSTAFLLVFVCRLQ